MGRRLAQGIRGWHIWRRIDDHSGEFGAAAAVDRAILTWSTA
jgi:hypothetical protein